MQREPRIQQITDEGVAMLRMVEDDDLPALVQALDFDGYDVNAKGLNEVTPLMLTCKKGNMRLMHELLNRGADPNVQDIDGKTSLVYATSHAPTTEEAMVNLLQAGGDVTIQDNRRKTVQSKTNLQGNVEKLIRKAAHALALEDMPRLDKLHLGIENPNGITPLDSPETWQRWEEVSTTLQGVGEAFSKDEFLQPRFTEEAANKVPQPRPSLMENAIRCRAFGAVKRDLERQGEAFVLEDIMPDGETVAPWVDALKETRQVGQLFTKDIWQSMGKQAMLQTYDALGEDGQKQVSNFHRLKAALQQTDKLRDLEQAGTTR